MAKILRSTDKNYVELDVQLVAKSGKAMLVSDGVVEEWVPLSQMEDEPELLDNGLTKIYIPEWLALEKGFI